MRVLQINIFVNLSTGRIAVDLYRTLEHMVMKAPLRMPGIQFQRM